MNLPVIALVGRPNVGKSTLFNKLTKTRKALVADEPGMTRDRQYGRMICAGVPCIVVDTGGLFAGDDLMNAHIQSQAFVAIEEADIILFVVDAKESCTAFDELIAKHLRQKAADKTLVVVNKIDGEQPDIAVADFYQLGFSLYPIVAKTGRGLKALTTHIAHPYTVTEEQAPKLTGTRIAIVGKPNVGKSTLVNQILGEERVVALDVPGTTRDSIELPFTRFEKDYVFIDTAGIRKKRKVTEKIEKFSVISSLQAIEQSDVVLLVIDAENGLHDQDLTILNFIVKAGRALVIVVNKWDLLTTSARQDLKQELTQKLNFVHFAITYYVSALKGTNTNKIFHGVNQAMEAAVQDLTTNKLTTVLKAAITAHAPVIVGGQRIKLRYAHQGGKLPPVIVIHGNQTDKISHSYQRYLTKYFRQHFNFTGTPIKLIFKTTDNPFKA